MSYRGYPSYGAPYSPSPSNAGGPYMVGGERSPRLASLPTSQGYQVSNVEYASTSGPGGTSYATVGPSPGSNPTYHTQHVPGADNLSGSGGYHLQRRSQQGYGSLNGSLQNYYQTEANGGNGQHGTYDYQRSQYSNNVASTKNQTSTGWYGGTNLPNVSSSTQALSNLAYASVINAPGHSREVQIPGISGEKRHREKPSSSQAWWQVPGYNHQDAAFSGQNTQDNRPSNTPVSAPQPLLNSPSTSSVTGINQGSDASPLQANAHLQQQKQQKQQKQQQQHHRIQGLVNQEDRPQMPAKAPKSPSLQRPSSSHEKVSQRAQTPKSSGPQEQVQHEQHQHTGRPEASDASRRRPTSGQGLHQSVQPLVQSQQGKANTDSPQQVKPNNVPQSQSALPVASNVPSQLTEPGALDGNTFQRRDARPFPMPNYIDPTQVFNPYHKEHERRRQEEDERARREAEERSRREEEERAKKVEEERAKKASASASRSHHVSPPASEPATQRFTSANTAAKVVEEKLSTDGRNGATVGTSHKASPANSNSGDTATAEEMQSMMQRMHEWKMKDPALFQKLWDDMKKGGNSLELKRAQTPSKYPGLPQPTPQTTLQPMPHSPQLKRAPMVNKSPRLPQAKPQAMPHSPQLQRAQPSNESPRLPQPMAQPTFQSTIQPSPQQLSQSQPLVFQASAVLQNRQSAPEAKKSEPKEAAANRPTEEPMRVTNTSDQKLGSPKTTDSRPQQIPRSSTVEAAKKAETSLGQSAPQRTPSSVQRYWSRGSLPKENPLPKINSSLQVDGAADSSQRPHSHPNPTTQPPRSGLKEPKRPQAPPAEKSRPATGNTIWPEAKRNALAHAAERALVGFEANKGLSITAAEINSLLEQNPSYMELCRKLEDRGFAFNRSHFAKFLLSSVPELGSMTPQPSKVPLPSAIQNARRLEAGSGIVTPTLTAGASQMNSLHPRGPQVQPTSTPPVIPPQLPMPSPVPVPKTVPNSKPKSCLGLPPISAPVPTPGSKEAMARKRNFSELVDLTAISDDEDELALPKHQRRDASPDVSTIKVKSNVSVLSKRKPASFVQRSSLPGHGSVLPTSKPKSSAHRASLPGQVFGHLGQQSAAQLVTTEHPNHSPPAQNMSPRTRTYPPTNLATAKLPPRCRHPLARPLKKSEALRKSFYDPTTIARDVLIAAGHHPTERALNGHMMGLLGRHIDIDSDLSTFDWNAVDPGGPPMPVAGQIDGAVSSTGNRPGDHSAQGSTETGMDTPSHPPTEWKPPKTDMGAYKIVKPAKKLKKPKKSMESTAKVFSENGENVERSLNSVTEIFAQSNPGWGPAKKPKPPAKLHQGSQTSSETPKPVKATVKELIPEVPDDDIPRLVSDVLPGALIKPSIKPGKPRKLDKRKKRTPSRQKDHQPARSLVEDRNESKVETAAKEQIGKTSGTLEVDITTIHHQTNHLTPHPHSSPSPPHPHQPSPPKRVPSPSPSPSPSPLPLPPQFKFSPATQIQVQVQVQAQSQPEPQLQPSVMDSSPQPYTGKRRGRPRKNPIPTEPREPKRRGRPPGQKDGQPRAARSKKTGGVSVQISIPASQSGQFGVFACQWRNCGAKLHNLETLQKHVSKTHLTLDRGDDQSSSHICWWKSCRTHRRDGNEIVPEVTFNTIKDLDEHLSSDHYYQLGKKLGDGPSVKQPGKPKRNFEIFKYVSIPPKSSLPDTPPSPSLSHSRSSSPFLDSPTTPLHTPARITSHTDEQTLALDRKLFLSDDHGREVTAPSTESTIRGYPEDTLVLTSSTMDQVSNVPTKAFSRAHGNDKMDFKKTSVEMLLALQKHKEKVGPGLDRGGCTFVNDERAKTLEQDAGLMRVVDADY